MDDDVLKRDIIWHRALTVNLLIAARGLDAAPLRDDQDLRAWERRRWEERLGLRTGVLDWRRFPDAFQGPSPEVVAGQLLAETSAAIEAEPKPEPTARWEATIGDFLAHVDVEPRETLWLTGSEQIGRQLAGIGVVVADMHQRPRRESLVNFYVAVLCRGPQGHKVFNPWTNAIKRLEQTLEGPILLRSASSNLSGIALSVYGQRDVARDYVHRRLNR